MILQLLPQMNLSSLLEFGTQQHIRIKWIFTTYRTEVGSPATLSQARAFLAATSVENLVLFGGSYNYGIYFYIADIYNVASNTLVNPKTRSRKRG
jgi:hypothetical protein